jgi:hypothetical protein
MRRAFAAAALLCLAPLQPAHAARLRSCSDTGAGQHPRLRRGSYEVATQDGVAHLYFTDATTRERKQLGDGEWGRTTGLVTHKNWVYVIAAGHLLRANPETGEWFPKPRDGKGRCAFYEGWAGPLWVEKGALYGVKTSRERPDERMIAKIDFDAAKGEVVGKYAPARAEVK